MSSITEGRQNERISKTGSVEICWRRGLFCRRSKGSVVNVSAAGLQACMEDAVPVGRKVKVRILFFAGGGESSCFRLRGVVKVCRPADKPCRNQVGIMLTSTRGDRGAWNDEIFSLLRGRNEY